MFARVLLGADLSLSFERELACLAALRGLGTREVVLVHALGLRYLKEMRHALAPLVEPALAAQRQAVEQLGLRASAEIAAGLPAPELVRIARERAVSLILLGADSSRARELLLGSVVAGVLHSANLPVLVCGAHPDPGIDLRAHVLYATDFSPSAEGALEVVEQLVRAGARRLTLLCAGGVEGQRGLLEHLRTRLLLLGAGDVRSETPGGPPAEAITSVSQAVGATLLVLGTRGRSSPSALYLGSVSHEVARSSPVPVLLVPPDREAPW